MWRSVCSEPSTSCSRRQCRQVKSAERPLRRRVYCCSDHFGRASSAAEPITSAERPLDGASTAVAPTHFGVATTLAARSARQRRSFRRSGHSIGASTSALRPLRRHAFGGAFSAEPITSAAQRPLGWRVQRGSAANSSRRSNHFSGASTSAVPTHVSAATPSVARSARSRSRRRSDHFGDASTSAAPTHVSTATTSAARSARQRRSLRRSDHSPFSLLVKTHLGSARSPHRSDQGDPRSAMAQPPTQRP